MYDKDKTYYDSLYFTEKAQTVVADQLWTNSRDCLWLTEFSLTTFSDNYIVLYIKYTDYMYAGADQEILQAELAWVAVNYSINIVVTNTAI